MKVPQVTYNSVTVFLHPGFATLKQVIHGKSDEQWLLFGYGAQLSFGTIEFQLFFIV
jgi:hypothetical protein